jgi:hypothetical protein
MSNGGLDEAVVRTFECTESKHSWRRQAVILRKAFRTELHAWSAIEVEKRLGLRESVSAICSLEASWKIKASSNQRSKCCYVCEQGRMRPFCSIKRSLLNCRRLQCHLCIFPALADSFALLWIVITLKVDLVRLTSEAAAREQSCFVPKMLARRPRLKMSGRCSRTGVFTVR